jgi:hypothetical protein
MMDVSYINEKLTYPINSMGYRDIEFDNIDWSDTYVMQGCSFVCGVAVPDNSSTLPSLLSAKLNKKIVNLGVLGSSIQFQYMNAIHMIENNIIPKGIFILYPFPERFLSFHSRGRVLQYGPNFASNSVDDKNNIARLSRGEQVEWMIKNAKFYNHYFLRGYRLLWKGLNVPLYEIGYGKEGIADTTFLHKDIVDFGTDNKHWGPLTNAKIAGIFEKIFNENTK